MIINNNYNCYSFINRIFIQIAIFMHKQIDNFRIKLYNLIITIEFWFDKKKNK